MSNWVEQHIPCPHCGSSDAGAIDSKGNFHCFSCNAHDFADRDDFGEDTERTYSYQYLSHRGVSREIMERYGVRIKVDDATDELISIGFPYGDDAVKVRSLQAKSFRSIGNMGEASLFGMDRFSAGTDTIIITEGEYDAMSANQMTGYPAVSVRGASSARKDCSKARDYLNSFSRIFLCFDNDAPGQKATLEVAQLFDNLKVYQVEMTKHKDANAYLDNGDATEFRDIVRSARRFLPKSVTSSFSEIEKILAKEAQAPLISYPFPTLQGMTDGIRTKEIVLVTAMEGVGKTEILGALEDKVLQDTDVNIGVIHLEESTQRSIERLAGYELGQPVHKRDSSVSLSEKVAAYKKRVKRDERVYHINSFETEDPTEALDLIRFLVTVCGCKIIFLDHISQLVSGNEEDDERKVLDRLSTRLEKMVIALDFALVMISHVNDEGKTRGSRYISKCANVRIDMERDVKNPDPIERNKTYLTVSKNRFGSTTGPAGILYFDPSTFLIKEWNPELNGVIPGEL